MSENSPFEDNTQKGHDTPEIVIVQEALPAADPSVVDDIQGTDDTSTVCDTPEVAGIPARHDTPKVDGAPAGDDTPAANIPQLNAGEEERSKSTGAEESTEGSGSREAVAQDNAPDAPELIIAASMLNPTVPPYTPRYSTAPPPVVNYSQNNLVPVTPQIQIIFPPPLPNTGVSFRQLDLYNSAMGRYRAVQNQGALPQFPSPNTQTLYVGSPQPGFPNPDQAYYPLQPVAHLVVPQNQHYGYQPQYQPQNQFPYQAPYQPHYQNQYHPQYQYQYQPKYPHNQPVYYQELIPNPVRQLQQSLSQQAHQSGSGTTPPPPFQTSYTNLRHMFGYPSCPFGNNTVSAHSGFCSSCFPISRPEAADNRIASNLTDSQGSRDKNQTSGTEGDKQSDDKDDGQKQKDDSKQELNSEAGTSHVNMPTENPTDEPSQVPSEVTSQAPNEVPSQAPSEVPSQAPSEVPSQAPTEVPFQAPSEVPSQAPSEVPSQAPSEVPSQVASEVPAQAPTEVPSQAPIEVPSQESSEVPSQEQNHLGQELSDSTRIMAIDSPRNKICNDDIDDSKPKQEQSEPKIEVAVSTSVITYTTSAAITTSAPSGIAVTTTRVIQGCSVSCQTDPELIDRKLMVECWTQTDTSIEVIKYARSLPALIQNTASETPVSIAIDDTTMSNIKNITTSSQGTVTIFETNTSNTKDTNSSFLVSITTTTATSNIKDNKSSQVSIPTTNANTSDVKDKTSSSVVFITATDANTSNVQDKKSYTQVSMPTTDASTSNFKDKTSPSLDPIATTDVKTSSVKETTLVSITVPDANTGDVKDTKSSPQDSTTGTSSSQVLIPSTDVKGKTSSAQTSVVVSLPNDSIDQAKSVASTTQISSANITPVSSETTISIDVAKPVGSASTISSENSKPISYADIVAKKPILKKVENKPVSPVKEVIKPISRPLFKFRPKPMPVQLPRADYYPRRGESYTPKDNRGSGVPRNMRVPIILELTLTRKLDFFALKCIFKKYIVNGMKLFEVTNRLYLLFFNFNPDAKEAKRTSYNFGEIRSISEACPKSQKEAEIILANWYR